MAQRQCKVLDDSVISRGFMSSFDYVLTDCDGVLWNEDDAIPGSVEAIKALVEAGKHVLYVTNNCIKDRKEYLKKFLRLGLPAKLEDIFPTSYCAAVYLQSLKFKKKAYIFGSEGLETELNDAGIETLPIGPDPLIQPFGAYVESLKLEPEVGAVVVGFDEHFSYPKLIKAASYLKNPNCLFLASCRDERCISNNLLVAGTGTFVKAVEIASARESVVLGKPSRHMIECVKTVYPDINTNRCLMIGDRLNTDILLGTSNGMKTLLVLTGVSSLKEVQAHEKSSNLEDHLLVPDFYLPCLGNFTKLLVK